MGSGSNENPLVSITLQGDGSRSRPGSNWSSSFCRAEPNHSATGPSYSYEYFIRTGSKNKIFLATCPI